MTAQTPRRGEVWLVDFTPGRGSEQRGTRPALIVQNDVGNAYAATPIVATITSTIRIYPVTVPLERGEAGLSRRSMVNLAQLLTVATEHLQQRLGSLSTERMETVDRAIRVGLDV